MLRWAFAFEDQPRVGERGEDVFGVGAFDAVEVEIGARRFSRKGNDTARSLESQIPSSHRA
jgi:hypothetical protein